MKKTTCVFLVVIVTLFTLSKISFGEEINNEDPDSFDQRGAWKKVVKEVFPSPNVPIEPIIHSIISVQQHSKITEYINNIKPSYGVPRKNFKLGAIPKPLLPSPAFAAPPPPPAAPQVLRQGLVPYPSLPQTPGP